MNHIQEKNADSAILIDTDCKQLRQDTEDSYYEYDIEGGYDSSYSEGMTMVSHDESDNFDLVDLHSNNKDLASSFHGTRSWTESFRNFRDIMSDATYVARSRHSKVFRDLDQDCDRKVSKHEISEWIKENPQLWGMLNVNLNLPESECIDIATRVFMQINAETDKTVGYRDKEMQVTKNQFKNIMNLYVDDPKGSQEFFHRSVFAAYDEDGNNTLDREEFEQFIDVFYQKGSIFRGDARLPQKEELLEMLYKKYDANNDGLFTFEEVKPIISGLAFQDILSEDKTPAGDNPDKEKSKSSEEKNMPRSNNKPLIMVSPIFARNKLKMKAEDSFSNSCGEKEEEAGAVMGLVFWSNGENKDDCNGCATDSCAGEPKRTKKIKNVLGSLFWREQKEDSEEENEEESDDFSSFISKHKKQRQKRNFPREKSQRISRMIEVMEMKSVEHLPIDNSSVCVDRLLPDPNLENTISA